MDGLADTLRRFRNLGYSEAIVHPDEWDKLTLSRSSVVWEQHDGQVVIVIGNMLVWTWNEEMLSKPRD